MKKLTILSLLAIATLNFTACKKNCCVVGPQNDFLAAKKGTTEWVSKTQESNTYQDSLNIFARVGEEHLRFRIKFAGAGNYVLKPSQVNYMVTVGGDVTVMEYHGDSAAESVLNIKGYDADSKIIFGDFKLNIYRDHHYDSLSTATPLKLAFTNGSFKMHLGK